MSNFEECSLGEILKDKTTPWHHNAHCMIWATWDSRVFGKHPTKAAILMQLRHDGSFGFPGGMVVESANNHQDIVDGLMRELVEEMNLDIQNFKLTTDDHLLTHRTPGGNNCYHFYALRVNMEDIASIERAILTAKDYGNEVFGSVRVPLYTMENGVHGFPNFLKNVFIGNAKVQLLNTIKHHKILTENEIQQAVSASQ